MDLLILGHNYCIFPARVYYNTRFLTILFIINEDKKRLKIRSARFKLKQMRKKS